MRLAMPCWKIIQFVDGSIKERLRPLNSLCFEAVPAPGAAGWAGDVDNPLLMSVIPYSLGIIYKMPLAACPSRSRDNLFEIWSVDHRKCNTLINIVTNYESWAQAGLPSKTLPERVWFVHFFAFTSVSHCPLCCNTDTSVDYLIQVFAVAFENISYLEKNFLDRIVVEWHKRGNFTIYI